MDDFNISINNLKSMEELSDLVSKTITQVIRFSTNQEFKQTCLVSLNVKNSNEAEKTIYHQLLKCSHSQPCNISNLSSETPKLKQEAETELTREITINDLDDWQ